VLIIKIKIIFFNETTTTATTTSTSKSEIKIDDWTRKEEGVQNQNQIKLTRLYNDSDDTSN
jgi:hypothetical protein